MDGSSFPRNEGRYTGIYIQLNKIKTLKVVADDGCEEEDGLLPP